MNEARDYMSQFLENVGNSLNLEKKEVAEIYEKDLVTPLREERGMDISVNSVSNIVQDTTGKGTGSLELIQSRFNLFPGCNGWGDVAKEVAKVTGKVYKENFMICTFAAGVALVVIDNVTPVLRYVVGPSLIQTGYNNSKVLKKVLEKKVVDKYVQVDLEKGLSGK